MELVFGIFIGGWIAYLEFLKGALLKTGFFGNFQKLSKQQLFQHSLKNM